MGRSFEFPDARFCATDPFCEIGPADGAEPEEWGNGAYPAAGPVVAESAPGSGLVHCYIIHPAREQRIALHKLLSGRSDMAVRSFADGTAFLEDAADLDEGCVVYFAGGDSGAVATFIRELTEMRRFACLMLAEDIGIRTAIAAMKAGAVDCLPYPCETQDILAAVEDALTVVRHIAEENAVGTEAQRQIGRLTARERDVLEGLLEGKSNKMIALDLSISPRTVEIYRAHLMEKLGTKSLSDTLKIAFAAGLG